MIIIEIIKGMIFGALGAWIFFYLVEKNKDKNNDT